MNLTELKKIGFSNIRAAGPRYSPIIDPSAPNLEIVPLVSAIEALALTEKYRVSITDLEQGLIKAWDESSKATAVLFPDKSPKHLMRLLGILKKQKPGKSELTLKLVKKFAEKVSSILQKENGKLYEQERGVEEHSEPWNAIQSELSSIRRLESSVRNIHSLIRIPNFKLITTNRMLLLGEWGTGKTHLLCDITKERIARNLPTLFFLAHHLPPQINPLEAICKSTQIASTPKILLRELDRLGKISGTRSLLIIDGINEADRTAWKKYMPDIVSLVKKHKNVALILSCRSPFDRYILTKSSRQMFVQVFHNGFQEIEFNAQRTFFKYYKIPNPHIPLLTPEFSRPLFLKILCLTFSGQTSSTRSRWINEIASGQRSMTKLFEDFVSYIGSKIESNFCLSPKTCWRILKGHKTTGGKIVGIAVSMADQVKDYLDPKECLLVIKQVSGKSNSEIRSIFNRMVTEGLLTEDVVWENGVQRDVVRLPYQRFSDHLISRHLLKQYLRTFSEQTIRQSFYKHRPLGKVFEIDTYGRSYRMPGIASVIMLEFPERVKNVLPIGERELVFYLPKRERLLSPLIDTFLEGVLWRSKDSFSNHTDNIFGTILDRGNVDTQRRTLETLVSLACRPGHPYSAQRLYGYLSKKKIAERDLLWSEFLRNAYSESVVHRLLNWVDDSSRTGIDKDMAENLILLLSLFLTTTDKPLRDRATRSLVLIGERQPKALFEKTILSLNFNDPYVSERMLAASYGTLMRSWAFPSTDLKNCISDFANKLYDAIFMTHAPCATTHILSRDYALGALELARRVKGNCLVRRPLKNLKKPFQPPMLKIPSARRIKEDDCKPADSAINMDFGNYTIGRLISDRRNYDSEHSEYRGVVRQIKWRILNLGYSTDLFKDIDHSIGERSFYREQKENAGKIDRYGKKYSWIAFFEVAGMRADQGLLPDRYTSRVSDSDIDPSFPENLRTWEPVLKKFFTDRFTSARLWAANGKTPSYNHLLKIQKVDNLKGPWVLLGGYITESAPKDPRKVFTFINGVFARPIDISKLRSKFNAKEYPGNREIPEPWQDYYTFAGEIPWSEKYGGDHHQSGKIKRHIDECFEGHKNFTIRKKVADLSKSEKFSIALKSVRLLSEDSILGGIAEANENMKTLPKYIEVPQYKTIPGVPVEVPVHRLSWESYHSTENQGGVADFIAPALCDFLQLRNRENFQDLFDTRGNQASVFRLFGDSSEYFKSTLLYMRKDLLEKYLLHTNQKLVWFIWGERDFKNEALQAMRSQIQDIWSSHGHIHKKMKVARLG